MEVAQRARGVAEDIHVEPHILIEEFIDDGNGAEMIAAAQILGREWDFIRVDFYDTAERLYFGEMTLTPNEGRVRFRPQQFDEYLGSLWKKH
jgi:hypothetical protein